LAVPSEVLRFSCRLYQYVAMSGSRYRYSWISLRFRVLGFDKKLEPPTISDELSGGTCC
jgi:hypothetical protein